VGRDPRETRTLGLWTAGWLAVLLLGGLLWLGDLSLQWPVLLVPLLWALVALRPRRRRVERPGDVTGVRTDTVERPALRPPDRWDGRRPR
jgi:membrane protein implicated in regulation of membrane protease activity